MELYRADEIGPRLRRCRKQRRMGQTVLSLKYDHLNGQGCRHWTNEDISRLERGNAGARRTISRDELVLLAKALSISVQDLMPPRPIQMLDPITQAEDAQQFHVTLDRQAANAA